MKTIQIPIYGGKLIVVRSQAQFDKAFDRLLASGSEERTEETLGLSSGGMTASAVVADELVIVSGAFDGGTASTCCHEAVHCAQAVAGAIGMDAVKEVEAFAYLVQWFYEELAP